MCQAYEGEKAYLFRSERAQRRARWEAHKSGEQPLTDEELQTLMVEEMMARDAGY